MNKIIFDDDLFESLSTGKKGNKQLLKLRNKHGVDNVIKHRIEGKTPKQVDNILAN